MVGLMSSQLRAKDSARTAFLTARSKIDPGERAAADSALVTFTMGTVVSLQASTVLAYVPMKGEPGGPALVDALRTVAGRVLLPVLRDDLDLDWGFYRGESALVGGRAGLREPGGPRLGVDAPLSAELMIVPAVAVDRCGMRLGRGGGSFDRVLTRLAAARLAPGAAPDGGPLIVALLYDGELVDEVPAEPHDRPVHAVITPSDGLFRLFPSVDQDTKAGRGPG
jgi:5-formyltetrahydrofolate cyclo-ligase